MASTQNRQQPERRGPVPLDEKSANSLVKGAQGKFLAIVRKNPEQLRPAWAREVAYATQIILKNKNLREAEPASITNTVINLASVGLTLNPIKQHCTIVPRWNKDVGLNEAHLMVMYRGLVYLASQAGVTDIVADVVYAMDEFDPITRTERGDSYRHTINVMIPRGGDDNPFRGVYVAARMPSGNMKVEWIPAEDIYKMRAHSESYWLWDYRDATRADGSTFRQRYKTNEVDPDSTWVVWFDEMAKKSGIKRAQKRWEEAMQDESRWQHFRKAVDLDNKATGMRFQNAEDAEIIAVPALTLEQITEIEKRVGDLTLRDPKRYIAQICQVYGKKALSEIANTKYTEILGRIQHTKEEAESRRKAKA